MLGVILDTLQKFEILAVAKSIQMKTLCCNCTFQYVPKMYEYMDFFYLFQIWKGLWNISRRITFSHPKQLIRNRVLHNIPDDST